MSKARTHVIRGQRDQVYAALSRAVEDGRLISVTDARVLPQQQIQLVARLREPVAARSGRVRPWLVVAGKTLAVLVALTAVGGLIWLVVSAVLALVALVAAVIAWIQAHLLVIGLVVVGLLALLLSGGRCGGIHCGGCRG